MSSLRMLRIVFVLSIIGLVFLDPGFARGQGTPGDARYAPRELIVKFKPGVEESLIEAIGMYHGTWRLERGRPAGLNRMLILGDETVEEMVKRFGRLEEVEYAEPNYIAHAHMIPNDPGYELQWHLSGINMEAAWDISTGSGVVVAVVDTGVAYENYGSYVQAPDLVEPKFVAGYDFVNNDNHPNDDNSHGTHVAGTIAQSTNNGKGVAGVAYNCSIMPVKVLDENGSGYYFWIADGIRWAADHGANVINMSLGGSQPSTTLKNAVRYAYNNGVTVIASAGNNGRSTVSYPAAYDDYVIAVGATRYDETLSYYSNYGNSLDLVAPGGDVTVDQNGDGYGDGVLQNTFDPDTKDTTDFGYWFFQGTSMAAPHVSGVAALVISLGIDTTPDRVRNRLQSTAEDLGTAGWDSTFGSGLVDAYAAVNYGPTENHPPVADPNGPYTGTVGVAITFDGSGSSDPDGDPLTYLWDFGDNSTGTEVNPTHTYTAPGTYTVILVVNDGTVDSLAVETTATVTEAGQDFMHVASIEMSTTTKNAGKNVFTTALATVTIVDADDAPVAGATVYGHWSGATTDVDSAITDSGGNVTLQSDQVKNASGMTFIFTVDNVTKEGGWIYDSATNVETSDSITITSP